MKKENIQNGIAIQSGKTTDSMEKLTKLCEQEAEKMLSTIEIPENEVVSVPFWVQEPGFPELICVGKFKRDESGKIVYELDFSESTL